MGFRAFRLRRGIFEMIATPKVGDFVWCVNYVPQAQSIKLAEYEVIADSHGTLMLTRTIINEKRGRMKIFPRALILEDCFHTKDDLLYHLKETALHLLK